jgi:hypothetical protein
MKDANPDGAFVRCVVDGEAAFPAFDIALEAHRIVEAMYRSARNSERYCDPEEYDEAMRAKPYRLLDAHWDRYYGNL